jgi:hypothetical protein
MNNLTVVLIIAITCLTALFCGCTSNSIAGGTVDTGNAKVTAVIYAQECIQIRDA